MGMDGFDFSNIFVCNFTYFISLYLFLMACIFLNTFIFWQVLFLVLASRELNQNIYNKTQKKEPKEREKKKAIQ